MLQLVSTIAETPSSRQTLKDKPVRSPGAIRETVDRLSSVQITEREYEDGIFQSLLNREAPRTTGIGNGIAVPHARRESVGCLVGAMGLSRQGIEFNSLDGHPVHAIFLFVVLPFGALERVSRHLRDWDHFRSDSKKSP